MAIPNRGPELIGMNVAFLATAIIANALRCIVRLKMVKAFGVDDWLMVASTVSIFQHHRPFLSLINGSFFSLVMVLPRQQERITVPVVITKISRTGRLRKHANAGSTAISSTAAP